ncbi:MAG: DUF3459 domain-containing protein, partial [Nitrospirae bacterium]
PPAPGGGPGYGGQLHLHDENHPDVHVLLRRIRKLVDAYPERMTVGEVYIMDPAEVAKYYGRGDELHLAFNFSFLRSPFEAAAFRREVERFEALLPENAWPDVVLSNHDVPRHASRYDHPELGDARARLLAAMLLTLRGTPFLYYGEEIGMRNQVIPAERMQDPLARTLHPALCRDGERTPMPWTSEPGAGFTRGEPWLPVGEPPPGGPVDRQREDPTSLLHLYRRLLGLRRRWRCLHAGSFRSLEAPEGIFAYERRAAGERALVALNFLDTAAEVELRASSVCDGLSTRPDRPAPPPAGRVRLAPAEGVVLVQASDATGPAAP